MELGRSGRPMTTNDDVAKMESATSALNRSAAQAAPAGRAGARSQKAKSFELRAAIGLARLRRDQGKHQEACDLLAPVLNWFTKGYDTSDLIEAKTLLRTLVS
jgi:predicted ATPase